VVKKIKLAPRRGKAPVAPKPIPRVKQPKVEPKEEEKAIEQLLGENIATPILGKIKPKRTLLGNAIKVLISLAIVAVAAIVVFGVGIYAFSWNDQITKTIKQWIPYPALAANYFQVTSLSAYDDEVNYVKNLYGPDSKAVDESEKIDFSTKEGKQKLADFKKQIINKFVENAVVEKLAAKYNISAKQKEVDDLYKQYYNAYKAQDFDISTIPAVKSKFRIQVLLNKLSETVPVQVKASHILIKVDENAAADAVTAAQARAQDILSQLEKGADFAELAKKYSEDTGSKDSGGDLGWFGRGDMVKEFEDAAFALKKGKISNLVRTSYGFHIIKVTDKRGTVDKNFKEWFNENVSKAIVWKFVTP